MDKMVEQYYELKLKQREIEKQMKELRAAIMAYCEAQNADEKQFGGYKVKLVQQERREYDEEKLFQAIPDLEVWRMLSKPDVSKIASLQKLNVVSEEKLKDTYAVKKVTLFQVDKL